MRSCIVKLLVILSLFASPAVWGGLVVVNWDGVYVAQTGVFIEFNGEAQPISSLALRK